VNIFVNTFAHFHRSGRMESLEPQVRDGLALSSFRFVAERLVDQFVDSLDPLDDEVTFFSAAADVTDHIDVLEQQFNQ
jgi:hypothetical protein